jgi:hypothetical protein
MTKNQKQVWCMKLTLRKLMVIGRIWINKEELPYRVRCFQWSSGSKWWKTQESLRHLFKFDGTQGLPQTTLIRISGGRT